MKPSNPKELAFHEIEWWKAHHRKDVNALTDHMSKLYASQYDIPYGVAFEAVKLRVEATQQHDIAEKFEDEGNQEKADEHWHNAQGLLEDHFDMLYKHMPK